MSQCVTVAEALELAASMCEQMVERNVSVMNSHGGRWGGYGNFKGPKTGPECAADIRALIARLQAPPRIVFVEADRPD